MNVFTHSASCTGRPPGGCAPGSQPLSMTWGSCRLVKQVGGVGGASWGMAGVRGRRLDLRGVLRKGRGWAGEEGRGGGSPRRDPVPQALGAEETGPAQAWVSEPALVLEGVASLLGAASWVLGGLQVGVVLWDVPARAQAGAASSGVSAGCWP